MKAFSARLTSSTCWLTGREPSGLSFASGCMSNGPSSVHPPSRSSLPTTTMGRSSRVLIGRTQSLSRAKANASRNALKVECFGGTRTPDPTAVRAKRRPLGSRA